MVPGGRSYLGWILLAAAFCGRHGIGDDGVGGGFITYRCLSIVFGISTFTTVGPTSSRSCLPQDTCAITQLCDLRFCFYTLAMGMLLGSLFGISDRALTTKVVSGMSSGSVLCW
jgi:hypothetical protein